jgi:hypothetical protein
MLKLWNSKKEEPCLTYEKDVTIVVDTISTTGVSLRTSLPAALSAVLAGLLGSCSAQIHSTDTATNKCCILSCPYQHQRLAAALHVLDVLILADASVDERAGRVFQPTQRQQQQLGWSGG